jgi:hypothetical protein
LDDIKFCVIEGEFNPVGVEVIGKEVMLVFAAAKATEPCG